MTKVKNKCYGKKLKLDRETRRLYLDFLRDQEQIEECNELISQLSVRDQEFFNRYLDNDDYWREENEL